MWSSCPLSLFFMHWFRAPQTNQKIWSNFNECWLTWWIYFSVVTSLLNSIVLLRWPLMFLVFGSPLIYYGFKICPPYSFILSCAFIRLMRVLLNLKFSPLFFLCYGIWNFRSWFTFYYVLGLIDKSRRLDFCVVYTVHCNITKKKRLQFLFYGMRCFPDSTTFTIDLHCCSLDASVIQGRK